MYPLNEVFKINVGQPLPPPFLKEKEGKKSTWNDRPLENVNCVLNICCVMGDSIKFRPVWR